MKKFSLKARINYETKVGSTYLIKLFVNNVLIEDWRLENKEKIKKYMDGREFNWYHDIHKHGIYSIVLVLNQTQKVVNTE